MESVDLECTQTFEPADIAYTYTDMLFRISFSMVGTVDDAEDILQNVFLKYHTKKPQFRDGEHCKAWLIRVTINESKNFLRFRMRRRKTDITALEEILPDNTEQEIFTDLMLLPPKYKTVLHLYYIEGYRTMEVAEMLGISPAAVRKRLEKGRKQLKLIYDKEAVL